MRGKHIVLCLMAIAPVACMAQQELKGLIKDIRTGTPLPGAVVYIPDLKSGAVSDSSGNYRLKNIPPGTFLVDISKTGYARHLETITIKGVSHLDYAMIPSLMELNEITITGVTSATDQNKSPVTVATVDDTYLMENTSTNVIDAVAKVPGVSAMTDGQSISKPVIRGLGYNRVLTINDGVEQVDQAWFDEFGIEADPDAVNRYEILKGPASLSYGSDAIAGVVNLIPEQPLPEGQTKGKILFDYQTNNGLINNMVSLAGTRGGIAWSARIDNIMAHAYQDPYDGYALNSQFSNVNADGTIGVHRKWGYTQLHGSYFDMKTGIVDGTRDSATGLMERQVSYPDLNNGQPTYVIPTEQEQKSYTPFCINQRIRHTKLVWDNSIAIGQGRVTGIFSWQKNQRQETNDPTMPNTPDIYYFSNAATYDIRYLSRQIGGFNYTAGVNGVYQSSQSLGTLMLIPNYNFFQIGGFAIVNQAIGKLHLSGGLRYDTRTFHGVDHWVDSTTQAPVAPDAPNGFHEFQGFTSRFSGLSFSAGVTYDLTSHLYVKANIARGWRAPNVAECGANGVHDGTVVYEIGDPALKPETSLEEDLVFGVRSKDVQVELDLFNNSIHDFIYAQGLQSVFGGDSINNSLNAAGLGDAPVYKYTQGKAQLYGGELSLDIHPSGLRWVELQSGLSVVYGSLLHAPDSVKYLPFVPPTRITADLKFNVLPSAKGVKNAYLKIGVLDCFEQKDVYQQYAIYNGLNTALTPFEYAASRSATKGYVLFNAGLGGDIPSRGRTACQVFIQCTNLFNTAYMDYMSRFKYYPVNYTTDRVGVFNMGRNLSVKLLIPLYFR
ncbi:TonB-dependent receptor [Dinghuibacter silviterrae]|uniref:Iron complex outermembrane receptor protein n=1 Tax=Dinghuibacter silviterrae TaxID=1539049 RepID=A0A4R8DEG2_9BACT|nr:TonB-dependent receptor [Dinghuibacter silviterrae]TDW95767.1 iron complex outermembrane receptor protein [Dinghuibacter silviterrae]